jgi:hypothetical protein
MLSFHTEERRLSMLTYVIDIDPVDLGAPKTQCPSPTLCRIALAIMPWRENPMMALSPAANWISMVACAGGLKNTSLMTGVALTGSPLCGPKKT